MQTSSDSGHFSARVFLLIFQHYGLVEENVALKATTPFRVQGFNIKNLKCLQRLTVNDTVVRGSLAE